MGKYSQLLSTPILITEFCLGNEGTPLNVTFSLNIRLKSHPENVIIF